MHDPVAVEMQYAVIAERVFAGEPVKPENPLFALGYEMQTELTEAINRRQETEDRFLRDLRQYKGIYEPDVEAAIGAGSKAFMRKTRVKVESVDARLSDLLFPASRQRNYEIDPTPEPTLPPEQVEMLRRALAAQTGAVDEDALRREVTRVAKEAAERMATRIDDQLTETKYREVCRQVLHSGNLYGLGILKGPLVERKPRVSYAWRDGAFVIETSEVTTPFIACVPVWRFYPDYAVTQLSDARYTWEHHRLSRSTFVALKQRRSFDAAKIASHIDSHPDGCIRLMNYEQQLLTLGERNHSLNSASTGQYDVFERWGYLSGDRLMACGVNIPECCAHESFFANIWMLPDGEIIKAVLAPIDGVEWPYHLYYYDKDETSFWGEGLPAIMRDDQEMINAAARMLLDNAAVTAGPQFEVFVPAFPPSANLEDIRPLKVWPRTGGDFQYPAVRQMDFDSHLPELIKVLELFDTNADEVTAVPKFTYGDNPQGGAAGTMGGLSMLMGQANIALKDQVVSFDEGVTMPFIAALYRWNMKFARDPAIKGDFAVKATGASSLVAREMRSSMLAQFSMTLQPEERMFIKWDEMTRQKAEAQELRSLVKTADEIKQDESSPMFQQQMQLQQMQQQMALQAQQLALKETEAKILALQAEAAKWQAEAQQRSRPPVAPAAPVTPVGVDPAVVEALQQQLAQARMAMQNKQDEIIANGNVEVKKAQIAAESNERIAAIKAAVAVNAGA